MVEDGAFSHKIDCVTTFSKILNPEEHSNCITGSKVTAIFLIVFILPIGRASTVKGLHLQPAQHCCFYHRKVFACIHKPAATRIMASFKECLATSYLVSCILFVFLYKWIITHL